MTFEFRLLHRLIQILIFAGPGELKIGLDVKSQTGMSLYRPAQQDLTVSLADNLIRPEMPDQVADFLQKITAKPMIRRLDFGNMQGKCQLSFLDSVSQLTFLSSSCIRGSGDWIFCDLRQVSVISPISDE